MTSSKVRSQPRVGTTLVEVIVVLVVLAVTATMAGVAFLPPQPHVRSGIAEQASLARHESVTSGHDVVATLTAESGSATLLARPDGSVLGADADSVQEFTGRPPHAAH